ncbi:hypothetical protein HMPREF2978_11610 [Corynebacterium sp. HMSC074C01]|uniref:type IV toxin-antitoxin system AbiEi family antitoxin domain-containing protein n=1 Tax=Corynebacterium sp. HMSC074C01 TaxID=1739482 RepID=UPI0008A1C20C|nr:type IV toxin-antitoxin system AbiEi family antitoxin domain-containing protein [Corynebacterium sp. HMSC074C01]OFP63044.1 hypothetical protein HMPREF2978_11610 [Corynebacterium sp. HMSC074C01]
MKAWTTAELREMGLSKEAIRRKLRAGKLFRVHRGIYSDEWSPLAVARALAHGLSRIHFTGKTAREIHLGRKLTFPLEAEGPRTLKGKNFRVTHSRLSATTKVNDLPVVQVLWAARRLASACGQLLEEHYRGKTGPERLSKDQRRMRRIPRRLKETIRHTPIGADSVPERQLSRRLRADGIFPEHNALIANYRFDLKMGKLIVEVDGWEHHKNSRAFQADRSKQNAAVAHGYTVLRFTADDIRYHLDDAVLLIKTTLEQLKGRKPKLPAVVMQPFWEWHVCM